MDGRLIFPEMRTRPEGLIGLASACAAIPRAQAMKASSVSTHPAFVSDFPGKGEGRTAARAAHVPDDRFPVFRPTGG